MKKNTTKAYAILFLVFVFGCVTGIGIDHLYQSTRRGPPWKHHNMGKKRGDGERPSPSKILAKKMMRDFDLTGEQIKAIEDVSLKYHDDFEELSKEMYPRFNEIRNKLNNEIAQILTEEQREVFLKKNQRKKFKRRTRRSHAHASARRDETTTSSSRRGDNRWRFIESLQQIRR